MNDRPTPDTDSQSCYGTYKEQGCQITLQSWDYKKSVDGEVVPSDFARNLERQRDVLLKALEYIAKDSDGITVWRMQYVAKEAIAAVKGDQP